MPTTHKIVVIDDSKVIRMRVKEMLPEGNFDVLEAKDGVQGLNLLHSENLNLIMLDFLLPKMNGWEVYQEIQKEPRLKAIPLVLMSGRKEEVTDKLPEPFEYFAFVEKPFDKKQLHEAIREAMTKAKKRPEPIPLTSNATESSGEIQELTQKVAKLENEVETLKKQVTQLIKYIQQQRLVKQS